jgi:hypothetical protein
VAASPDGGAARSSGVRFTKASADRVAKAVRTVELGSRDSQGLHYDKALGGGGKVFRVCEFTGTWSIDATKTITFRNQTTTPNTVTAVNLFAQVGTADTAVLTPCAIAREGTAWYLIAAKCL